MGKIFYLMGKSSSGKDTLYRGLRIEFPQLKPGSAVHNPSYEGRGAGRSRLLFYR